MECKRWRMVVLLLSELLLYQLIRETMSYSLIEFIFRTTLRTLDSIDCERTMPLDSDDMN